MSNKLLTAVWPLQMPSAEKAVLVALADSARDPDTGAKSRQTWLPMRGADGSAGILERTCLSERTVQRAITALCDARHISRQQKKHGVVYTVLVPLTPVMVTGVNVTGVTMAGVNVAGDAVTGDTMALTPVTMAPKASRTISSVHKASPYSQSKSDAATIDRATATQPSLRAHVRRICDQGDRDQTIDRLAGLSGALAVDIEKFVDGSDLPPASARAILDGFIRLGQLETPASGSHS